MEKYLFMKSALGLISQGGFFSRVVAIGLRVIAVVVALAGLVIFVMAWKMVFQLPAAGVLGGIIYQLLFVVAIYMVVHTLIIRANDIARLQPAEFIVIPIASIFLKLMGEIYACLAGVFAVGAGILTWFAGEDSFYMLRNILPFIPFLRFGGATFLGGLMVIVGGVLAAFFALMFFYLLSESIVVMVDLAKNTRITRQIAEQYDKARTIA